MWEVVVLHSLSEHGMLQNEAPLGSGRRPDVAFANSNLSFTADITTISDEGLDERNPHRELTGLMMKVKARLGLKGAGMDIRIRARSEQTSGGSRTVLLLPEHRYLQTMIKEKIEPQLRAQIAAGQQILYVVIENENTAIEVRIDPGEPPFNSAAYPIYYIPTIKDRNPLYNALRAKAAQLRGATGLVGIIVGDGGSCMLTDRQRFRHEISAQEIIDEFLRQHSSIHFILLLSVREARTLGSRISPDRKLHARLSTSKTAIIPPQLEALLQSMMGRMPKPVNMPINAAHRSREPGFGWGHHGGHEMSEKRIKLSAREVLEVLAGRCSVQDMNARHSWSISDDLTQLNTMLNPFERQLRDGCLPSSISIVKTDENDADDWIEIEFGDPDPAIVSFR